MAAILALKNIEYRQGEFRLLVDRLDLERGKAYALTGPNGAGKSTLLRIMALLERPDSGQVCYDGAEVHGFCAKRIVRREIPMVEQSPYLFSGTVYQNLAYGLKLRNIDRKEQHRRIAEALSLLALTEFASRQVDELSVGEARRVALARAVVLNTQILLLDEPTANVDNDSLALFELLVQRLIKRGSTVVFSTHDAALPDRLIAEVISINAGKITVPTDTCLPE